MTLDEAILMMGDDHHVHPDGMGKFAVMRRVVTGPETAEQYAPTTTVYKGPVCTSPTAAILAWAERSEAMPYRSRILRAPQLLKGAIATILEADPLATGQE